MPEDAPSGSAVSDERLGTNQAIFEHLFDHPVAGAAVAARSAGPRHFFARRRAAFDRLIDLSVRDGLANADVHSSVTILKTVFVFKPTRPILDGRAEASEIPRFCPNARAIAKVGSLHRPTPSSIGARENRIVG